VFNSCSPTWESLRLLFVAEPDGVPSSPPTPNWSTAASPVSLCPACAGPASARGRFWGVGRHRDREKLRGVSSVFCVPTHPTPRAEGKLFCTPFPPEGFGESKRSHNAVLETQKASYHERGNRRGVLTPPCTSTPGSHPDFYLALPVLKKILFSEIRWDGFSDLANKQLTSVGTVLITAETKLESN